MNPKPTAVTLLRPGPKDWESWVETEPGHWKQARNGDAPKEISTLALPVQSVCAVPLTVTTTEPDVVDGLIRVQLESRGVAIPAAAKGSISFRTVQELPDRAQILATALLDQDLPAGGRAAEAYDVSPSFLRTPKNGILIWRELGRWAVLFTRDHQVAHFQCLSQRELNREACLEILALRESLLLRGFISAPVDVEVRDSSMSSQEAQSMGETLGLPVRVESTDSLVTPREKSRLIPAKVAQARQSQSLKQRIILGTAIVLGIYVLLMGGWALRLAGMKGQIASMKRDLQKIEGVAGQVREARIEAERLEPAINYERFPLELFHRVTELLPDEGVRLTYFQTSSGKVVIRGEANDSELAVTLKAQLRGSEAFREYTWDFPQPEILPDNRARFTATGSLPEFTP